MWVFVGLPQTLEGMGYLYLSTRLHNRCMWRRWKCPFPMSTLTDSRTLSRVLAFALGSHSSLDIDLGFSKGFYILARWAGAVAVLDKFYWGGGGGEEGEGGGEKNRESGWVGNKIILLTLKLKQKKGRRTPFFRPSTLLKHFNYFCTIFFSWEQKHVITSSLIHRIYDL